MAAVLANEPLCLRAEVGDIWLNPAYKESRALQDVHYLLLDHLFGLGYRRVERRVDAGDVRARIDLPSAGFHLEGLLRKHMIVKVRQGTNPTVAFLLMIYSHNNYVYITTLVLCVCWGRGGVFDFFCCMRAR